MSSVRSFTYYFSRVGFCIGLALALVLVLNPALVLNVLTYETTNKDTSFLISLLHGGLQMLEIFKVTLHESLLISGILSPGNHTPMQTFGLLWCSSVSRALSEWKSEQPDDCFEQHNLTYTSTPETVIQEFLLVPSLLFMACCAFSTIDELNTEIEYLQRRMRDLDDIIDGLNARAPRITTSLEATLHPPVVEIPNADGGANNPIPIEA